MLTYVRSIQRRLTKLGFPVDVFARPIFSHPSEGLGSALDARFAEQQSKGLTTECHNVLTIEDIRVLISSEFCNKNNSDGFRNRLIFSICLAIGARTTELSLLECSQFQHQNVNGKLYGCTHRKLEVCV